MGLDRIDCQTDHRQAGHQLSRIKIRLDYLLQPVVTNLHVLPLFKFFRQILAESVSRSSINNHRHNYRHNHRHNYRHNYR